MHGRTLAAAVLVAAGLTAAPNATSSHFGAARLSAYKGNAQSGWTSTNWAGYAITRTRYTSVSATWTVPTVKVPPKRDAYSLTWIGIDGFDNSKLIQVGTEQDLYKGRPYYRAFWEILPAAETPISTISVHAGDAISASIAMTSATKWTITISDTTSHQSFSTQQTYAGPGSSAEWIHEAPNIGSRPTQLTATTPVTFDHGLANHVNPAFTIADSGRMVRNRNTIAAPSKPDSNRDGFTVAYGPNTPPPAH